MKPQKRLIPVVLLSIVTMIATAIPAGARSSRGIDLVFPQDATVTIFTSSWGVDRDGGERKHKGNDLMAPKMTPVYAAQDGVVTRMSSSERSGYYIVIRHPGQWETFYIHLNNDTPGTDDNRASREYIFADGLKVGDEVLAGDLIGYVGDSGNAEVTAPHIHFELHKNGEPIDPYPYLYPAFKRALAATATEVLPLMADLFTGLGATPLSRAKPQH